MASGLTILLTGGRAPVTLELARLFHAAGHRVVVGDSLPRQLCSWSRVVARNAWLPSPREQLDEYLAALVLLVKQEKVDWLIPTCEEIFYIAYGLPQLSQYCRVFAEPLEKLERLHNKRKFIEYVASLGLPIPPTQQVQSYPALTQCLAQQPGDRVVLKPVYSRFANQVHILSLPAPVLPELDIRVDYPWVVQAFIPGQQYCLYGIAHGGTLKAYAAYAVSFTANQGSCIYFQAVECAALLRWMQRVVAGLSFTGQIAFDVIVTTDGIIYPLECNPRAISAIHLFQVEDSLDKAFLNQTLPERYQGVIQPQPGTRRMISLAMAIYGLPVAMRQGQFRRWCQAFVAAQDVLFRWQDPGPFLSIAPLMWQFWRISRTTGQTLQQASTQDIEWDGEAMEKVEVSSQKEGGRRTENGERETEDGKSHKGCESRPES